MKLQHDPNHCFQFGAGRLLMFGSHARGTASPL